VPVGPPSVHAREAPVRRLDVIDADGTSKA